ncbi:MAG: imidazole glycerol phosphate synthase subunit HisH [Peptococcaceae bacterium]|jgi:glutamine amidotransferase|nr:imidazole glycerol phosphate synthase subunit HisH [Peptococcaceae bacterium]
MRPVAIIDFGMGNIRSVQKACEFLGYAAVLTADPACLGQADKAILPGVGAFGDAMAALRQLDFVEAIRAYAAAGKPLLGICLGMQLMFANSTEGLDDGQGPAATEAPAEPVAATGGDEPAIAAGGLAASGGGLTAATDEPATAAAAGGLAAASAQPATPAGGSAHSGLGLLPGVIRRFPADLGVKVPHIGWNQVACRPGSRLFAGLPANFYAYFVHSYLADDLSAPYSAGFCRHGADFVAAIEQGQLFATQFHPEKSGALGLAVLRNFLAGPAGKEARPC